MDFILRATLFNRLKMTPFVVMAGLVPGMTTPGKPHFIGCFLSRTLRMRLGICRFTNAGSRREEVAPGSTRVRRKSERERADALVKVKS
jgi:hypothetical protein